MPTRYKRSILHMVIGKLGKLEFCESSFFGCSPQSEVKKVESNLPKVGLNSVLISALSPFRGI